MWDDIICPFNTVSYIYINSQKQLKYDLRIILPKKTLFRKELLIEGNGDTKVPWEFQNKGVF